MAESLKLHILIGGGGEQIFKRKSTSFKNYRAKEFSKKIMEQQFWYPILGHQNAWRQKLQSLNHTKTFITNDWIQYKF